MSARHHKDRQPPASSPSGPDDRQAVRERVAELLDAWAADPSGHDDSVWPELKRDLEEHRLSPRRLFND